MDAAVGNVMDGSAAARGIPVLRHHIQPSIARCGTCGCGNARQRKGMEKMPGYAAGDWVIDRKRKSAPMVACVLPFTEAVQQLYVLVDDDGNHYITGEDSIMPYDKYYFC